MPNVLSEPALPNSASKETQILSNRTKVELDPIVLKAKSKVEEDPTNPDLWIKYGRALRRQSMHREAIEAYSLGLTYDPFNPLLYRHKGHSYINIGEFAMSAGIFELALRLDPTDWDLWYHQGVAYYLNENYKLAIESMTKALEIAYLEDNFDDIVACKDWLWLSYTQVGKIEDAEEIVSDIKEGGETDYSDGYYQRVLCYNGTYSPEEVMSVAKSQEDDHMYVTYAYGISRYYFVKGEEEKSYEVLKEINKRLSTAWAGFAGHAGRRDFYNWKNNTKNKEVVK